MVLDDILGYWRAWNKIPGIREKLQECQMAKRNQNKLSQNDCIDGVVHHHFCIVDFYFCFLTVIRFSQFWDFEMGQNIEEMIESLKKLNGQIEELTGKVHVLMKDSQILNKELNLNKEVILDFCSWYRW